jgi:hypothetical protein
MLEFTKHKGGIQGALSELPQEALFKVDGVEHTIPVDFPAMVGIAYASIQQAYGDAAALSWAMRTALGDQSYDALIDAVPSNEDFARLTVVVVGRIQGLIAPVPENETPEEAAAPKAPARPRATASRKAPAKRRPRS